MNSALNRRSFTRIHSALSWIPVFFLLIQAQAYGSTPLSSDLPILNEVFRPTIEEFEQFRDAHPDIAFTNSETLPEKALLENIPRLMAWIEFTFPGATFAPLGRDAVITGDALDAAYRLIGEPHRVLRVDLSGSSFTGPNQKGLKVGKVILDYLKSIGIDPVQMVKEDRKIIFGDRTTFGMSSQSRRIIESLYTDYSQNGGDPNHLFHRLGFVSLIDSANPLKESAQNYFNSLHGKRFPIETLRLPGITDSLAWHDSWHSPVVTEDKRIISRPGKAGDLEEKTGVLRDFHTLSQVVQSREFWLRVYVEFHRLGLKPKLPPQFKDGIKEDSTALREEFVRASPKPKGALSLEEIKVLFDQFEVRLQKAEGAIHERFRSWDDPLHEFYKAYGYPLEMNLRRLRHSQPELLNHYLEVMQPKFYETLVSKVLDALSPNPTDAFSNLSRISLMLHFIHPTQIETPAMRKVIAKLSASESFKQWIQKAPEYVSQYVGGQYQRHPDLTPSDRAFQIRKTVDLLDRISILKNKKKRPNI